jgi:hypothetical protein
LLPVWNVSASSTGRLPLSFSQWANHGAWIFSRKYLDVALPNSIAPSALPSFRAHPP